METSDVMPLLDAMRENFGPQIAKKFEKIAVEHLRDMTTKLRLTKDAISNEILRMEKAVNGEDTSDMAMDILGDEGDGGMMPELPGSDEMSAGDDMMTDKEPKSQESELPELDLGDDDEEKEPKNDDLSDLFHDDADDSAAGRPRKESYAHKGAKALSEARDPDAMILRAFKTSIREGYAPVAAANRVAKQFDIDFDGVLEVVKESAAANETSRVFTCCKDSKKAKGILDDAKASDGITYRMTDAGRITVSGTKKALDRLDSKLRDC
jgi:hypothetical protein